jgi:hypothetical protein
MYLFFLYILKAMGRAATSLSKLADTAREELPSILGCPARKLSELHCDQGEYVPAHPQY